ncbi:MAG: hypothetical protein N2234_06855 [Planctomycetota bacterium]|nr:hypothetical protein [Planctomycetota bacterium]
MKIHTFGHCISSYYGTNTAARGEKMLKDIAAGTGGVYTKIN